MADEDQNLSNTPDRFIAMTPDRESTIGPRQPFGRTRDGGFDSQTSDDIREELDANAQRKLQEEVAARSKQIVRVQRPLEIGHLVAPNSDSFGGYKAIHDFGLEGETGTFPVQFNPFQFGIFDGKIASAMEGDNERVGYISNDAHEDYPKYKDLRRNIAILRNMLYVECFGRDGYQSFVPSDLRNKEKLEKMAEMLGDALAKGKNGKAPFFNSLSVADASVPDQGVITMYNYLCKIEKEPWHRTFFDALKHAFSYLPFVSDDTSYEWNMKPIEQTPLAPVYMKMDALGIEPFVNYTPDSRGEKMANIGVQMDYARAQLEVPQMLDKPVSDEAIRLARIILENFKLRAGQNPRNSNLALNDADELQQMERIYDLSVIYKDKFSQLAAQNPEVKNNPAFLSANDAIAKLTYLIKQQALEDLTSEAKQNPAQVMAELMDRVPADHRPQLGETFDVLVARLENGLVEAARLRGLPEQWLGMSQQSALANTKSAEQQRAVLNQQGHEDVNAALQRARDTNTTARIIGTNSAVVQGAVSKGHTQFQDTIGSKELAGVGQQPISK